MNAQEKVVILDSVQSVKIINELVKKDYCFEQLKFTKELLKNEEARVLLLKKQNETILNAYNEKEKEALSLSQIIINDQKIIKKEKRRKSFWKYIGIASLSLSGFILISN
jgi:hypothetical protein